MNGKNATRVIDLGTYGTYVEFSIGNCPPLAPMEMQSKARTSLFPASFV